MATTKRTRLSQIFYNVRAEVIGLQGELVARDAIVLSVVEGLYATLEPSLLNLVENFRAGFNKGVNEDFVLTHLTCSCMVILPSMTSLSIFSGSAACDDVGGSIKGEHVFDPPVDLKVIEL